MNPFFHVLLAMAAMIAASRILGLVCKPIGQPQVIAEVAAGLLLGPSVLGQLAPAASSFLLPVEVAPYLKVVAELGIVVYMFLIGLELNMELLRAQGRPVLVIALAGMVVPFLLGSGAGTVLFPRLAGERAAFGSFVLFLGLALSVTAFPVLARILSERGLTKTSLGTTAIGCAAINDAVAWCLLALVAGVAQSGVDHALMTMGCTVAYMLAMLLVARPLLNRFVGTFDDGKELSQSVVAVVFLGLLASALITEWIGIHALFGAFLYGALISHESRIARSLIHKLEDLVGLLFLPAFFAFTGMRTEIQLLGGLEYVLIGVAIVGLAIIGKLGGSAAAAWLTGMPGRQALTIGALMNTRGLMELIVLNVGLDLKIISPTLFAMLVMMALVTTMATGPLLHWLKPPTEADDQAARRLETTPKKSS